VLSSEPQYSLASAHYRRLKRLMDVVSALFFMVTFPLHLFFVKAPFLFIGHCFQVLFARRTWIGYCAHRGKLPRIRKGILAPNGFTLREVQNLSGYTASIVDERYAEDYHPSQDLRTIYQNYRRLGG